MTAELPAENTKPGGLRLSHALSHFGLAVLLLSTVLTSSALATQGTYTPPMLKGDLDIAYLGGVGLIQLEDRSGSDQPWYEVASYAEQRHGLEFRGTFSPYHGIAVSLAIPILMHRQLNWKQGNGFHYDPVSARPTLAGGEALQPAALETSAASLRRFGPGDVRLGFRIVPFAQHGLPSRAAPINLAFDIELRFPSGANPIDTREDGSGFAGLGGPGLRLGATASRQFGPAEPYLSLHYRHNGGYEVAGQSATATDETSFTAGDSLHLGVGTEIMAFHDQEKGRWVRMDLQLTASYLGPRDTVSGLQLPTTLAATLGQRAKISERVEAGGDFSLWVSPTEKLALHFDIGASWLSPHSVERHSTNAYSVRTRNGSIGLRWGAGVRAHFR